MILPMKKITLLVLDSQKKAALKTLRNFGAVHVEKETASSDTLTELQTVYARLQQAESLITEAQPKKGAKQPEAAALNRHDLLEAVDGILDLKDQESNTLAAINKLTGDIEAYSSWGDFNPEDIRGFEENGIYLTMGELSEKSYAALPETVKTVRLVGGKKTVRFAIVSETADVPTDLPSDFTPLILPEMRLSAMKAEKERLQKRLPSFKARIGARTDLLAPLKAEKKKFEKEIEFETVHAGMAIIPLEDECDTENSAENTAASAVNVQAHSAAGTPCAQKEPRRLARLSGYILAEKQADFAGLAKANGWAFISDDPAEEDAVPTAMRHNRFVQLLTPLTDFLGTVPGYREPDISLWFLLFFGIFFAMIFGDGGYGGILVILSLIGIVKAKAKEQPAPLAMQMFFVPRHPDGDLGDCNLQLVRYLGELYSRMAEKPVRTGNFQCNGGKYQKCQPDAVLLYARAYSTDNRAYHLDCAEYPVAAGTGTHRLHCDAGRYVCRGTQPCRQRRAVSD